jgi:fructosamine-3-kinase
MSRRDIYYWKCDRPAAFHGTQSRDATDTAEATRLIESQLTDELRRCFATPDVVLSPGVGQGTHLTWNADVDMSAGGDGRKMFVRVENGPERDGQLALESAVLDRVRAVGVRTPEVYGCDASRERVPFAWQALERIDAPDLNRWFKQGMLDVERIAFAIGAAVATWQGIEPAGFGVLDVSRLGSDERLVGYHASYYDYFCLRLGDHLRFLIERGFLLKAQSKEIQRNILVHKELLKLPRGCLVHKDLALWNILGSPTEIAAFIDFDDAISGDPMDDLSLLACFHDAAFVARAFAGYESVRPLPANHRRRFWLHLLRNMIVKSVIRVGAGYFDRTDGFFLIGSGSSGADLRRFTLGRLELALRGLCIDADPSLRDATDV